MVALIRQARIWWGARSDAHRSFIVGLVVFLLLSTAFVTTTRYFSQSVLSGLPHIEDEFSYLYQARIFAQGHLRMSIPELRWETWQPFLIDYLPTNTRFSKYPPGWPLIMVPGVWLGDVHLIALLSAIANIFCTGWLGCRLISPLAGIVAATLVTFSPLFIVIAGTLMPHQTGLFFVNLTIITALKREKEKWLWQPGALSGVAIGILFLIRPHSVLVIGGAVISMSMAALLGQQEDSHFTRRRFYRFIACGAAVAALLPLYNYYLSGALRLSFYDLYWAFDKYGFGPGYGQDPHSLWAAWRNAHFDLSLASADLFGWQVEPVTRVLREFFHSGSGVYPGEGYCLWGIGLGAASLLTLNVSTDRKTRLSIILFSYLAIFLWAFIPTQLWGSESVQSVIFAYGWIGLGVLLLYAPLVLLHRTVGHLDRQVSCFLFWVIVLGVVVSTLPYWVGAQRYSVRYYSDGLSAAALITSVAICSIPKFLVRVTTGLVSRAASTGLVVAAFVVVTAYSFLNFTLPRLDSLRDLFGVKPGILQVARQYQAQFGDTVVLIKAPQSGPNVVDWTLFSPLLSATDPYLSGSLIAILNLERVESGRYSMIFSNRKMVGLEFREGRFVFSEIN